MITVATYCCVFSNSPYSQPSFSSWISRVMMSPSSKLRSVGLVPAMWGKMVLTRDLLLRLRPDDCDTEWDRGNSPILPWSGDRCGFIEIKTTHIWSRSSIKNNIQRTRELICVLSHIGVCRFNPPVPELRSVEVVIGDLGSGLNILASGLICAFRGGAGGGTRESWFFWFNEVHDEQTETHESAWVTRLFGLTGSSDYDWFTKA